MAAIPKDVTTLLDLASRGDAQARADLFPLVEAELRKIAQARLRHERPDQSLQTTVLVDDAYLKLVGNQDQSWEGRTQFYRYASHVMREILVDNYRKTKALKRGDGKHVPWDGVEPPDDRTPDPLARLTLQEDLLALDVALKKLEAAHPQLLEIVELHFFGGLPFKQIADDILHMPYRTVKYHWSTARAWLCREMSGGGHDSRV